MEQENKVCCQSFDPAPWDGQEVMWQDKLFVVGRVRAFMHIPLNFGSVCVRLSKVAEKAGALDLSLPWLSDENSLWGSDLYIGVTRDVPGEKMARLSGKFLTKVYEGPYRDVPKWIKDFQGWLKEKNVQPTKIFTWYTTCPKCAQKYGKNYVVMVAQV